MRRRIHIFYLKNERKQMEEKATKYHRRTERCGKARGEKNHERHTETKIHSYFFYKKKIPQAKKKHMSSPMPAKCSCDKRRKMNNKTTTATMKDNKTSNSSSPPILTRKHNAVNALVVVEYDFSSFDH